MLTLAAALSAAVAAFLVTGPAPAKLRLARVMQGAGRRPGERSSESLLPPGRPSSGRGGPAIAATESFLSSPRGRALAATMASLGGAVVIGGGFGLVVGLVAGLGVYFGAARLEPAVQKRDRERVQAMLPLAADLVTAALSVGCPPTDAVENVGRAVGGPLGDRLVAASAAARFSADPARAWSALVDDPSLKPLGRALVSATDQGTSPVPALARIAEDARETARWAAQSRARSLGARAAAPLGLCFLPAFVLLGIVPVVASSGLGMR